MSEISKNESKIAIARAGTWGTAAAGEHLIHGLITDGVTEGRFDSRGVGYSNFRQRVTRLEHSVNASIVSDIIHNGAWALLAGAFFGGDDKSTLNVEDIEHVMDLESNNDGKFVTLSYLTESAKAKEIPSFKPNSFTLEHDVNTVGTVSVDGFADQVLTSGQTNGPSQINALSYVSSDLENAVLSGANHYFRINAQGDGALDVYDEIPIQGITLTITRNHEQRFRLRGANTRYTTEPKQRGGFVDAQLTVRFSGLDSSIWDVIALWAGQALHKAEFFCDGSQIAGDGGNANASYKLQFPSIELVDYPAGTDHGGSNTGGFDPVLTFDIYQPVSAPTGMTGVTEPVRLTIINDNTDDLIL